MRRLGVLYLAAQAACAITSTTVTPPTGSLETHLSGGNGREVQLVIPLADERPAHNRCGMKKNTMNMETADVKCAAEPSRFLPELLADQLRAAGFKLVSEATPGADVVRIEGRLVQYFVEPKINMFTVGPEADVGIHLVAS